MTLREINECAKKAVEENTLRVYTPENKHLFPEDIQTFFDSIEKEPWRMYDTEKFWRKQKREVIKATQDAFRAIPQPSIKQVIIDILNLQHDILPPHNMIEVTTYIVEEWERLTKEVTTKITGKTVKAS